MQLAALITSSLFLLPDASHSSAARGLDRLDVMAPAALKTASLDQATVNAALSRLSDAGLSCESVPGNQIHILGGMTSFVARGIRGYERPFAILEEPTKGFTVAVAGAQSFHDEEVLVDDLSAAVDTVLQIIRARGLLSTTNDH